MPGTDEPSGERTPSAEIDTTKASIARVYDAFLGGKDNYESDQAVLRKVVEFAPEAPGTAKMFRSWLIRVSRFLAGPAGIDQFIDCGSGLPTAENTHQAVQRINPEAKVLYVDNDPIVAAHGRALLEENDNTHFVVADLRRPDELFDHPVVRKQIDLDRPLGLIQCATMHHVDDVDRPYDIMQSYIDKLPSGSYAALSHFHDPVDGAEYSALARKIEVSFVQSSMGTGWFRTREQIASFLDGLELVEPGLTELFNWWPDGPQLNKPVGMYYLILGAVGRKI